MYIFLSIIIWNVLILFVRLLYSRSNDSLPFEKKLRRVSVVIYETNISLNTLCIVIKINANAMKQYCRFIIIFIKDNTQQNERRLTPFHEKRCIFTLSLFSCSSSLDGVNWINPLTQSPTLHNAACDLLQNWWSSHPHLNLILDHTDVDLFLFAHQSFRARCLLILHLALQWTFLRRDLKDVSF